MPKKPKSNEVISRSEAIAAGLKRYFTGNPCKAGHIAERLVSNHTCVQCTLEKNNRKYAENPQEFLASRMRYYRQNRAQILPKMRENYRARVESDPDCNRRVYAKFRSKRIAESRRWAVLNHEKRAAQQVKRKAAKRQAVPNWYCEFDDFVAQQAAELCCRREALTGYAWHIDHMIPLQAKEACGLHVGNNLQVIPAALNMAKKNKLIITEPGQWLHWI